MDDSSPVCLDVFTGTSGRRDHPREFMESLNEEEAISGMSYFDLQELPDCPSMNPCDRSGFLPGCDRRLYMDRAVGKLVCMCV